MINFWWLRSSGDAVVSGLNPAAWFRFQQGITQAGGLVSQWSDQSGNNRHLLQATGTNQPALQSDGSILFDGVDNFMQCNAFTLNQPETIYILCSQVSWTAGDCLCDGTTANSGLIRQGASGANLQIFAGSLAAENSTNVVGTYQVLSAVYNGASSVLQVNNLTPTTGNPGAANMGGYTIGAVATPASYGNVQVKESIVFASAHDASTRAAVVSYLAQVGGISV